jgi:hypothetical protein
VFRIVDIKLPDKDQPVTPESFTFRLIGIACARRGGAREATYCAPTSPAVIRHGFGCCICNWSRWIRPIYHQTDARIEAHIFVAFMAYCLPVMLKQRLRALAGGLTPRSMLDKMAAIQMVDVHVPITDGPHHCSVA